MEVNSSEVVTSTVI